MTDNVIHIPFEKMRRVKEEIENLDPSIVFSHYILDLIHDEIHEETGICIFEQEEYDPIIILLLETIGALHMKTQNKEHPIQKAAEDLFSVDIAMKSEYNVSNDNDKENR